MPGYDIERFVNLTAKEVSELSCSICHEIIREPVVTNCCLQTFCNDCIRDWLRNHNSCPYDRKTLSVNGLRRAPRILTNLLGKLEIRCDYRKTGCEEVLHLENLEQHQLSCPFNIVLCDNCTCVVKPGHNCVRELLIIKNKLLEENDVLNAEKESLEQNIRENEDKSKQYIEVLKSERESLLKNYEEINHKSNEEINELKSEKQNLLKKINEIKETFKQEFNALKSEKDKLMNSLKQMTKSMDKYASSGSLQKSTSSVFFSEQNSIRDMINESRKYVNRPMITECNTSTEVADTIIAIVCQELRNNDNMFNICQNIVYKCDHEFGSSWYCLANYVRNGQNYCHSSSYIKIKFGSLLFKIFRTKFLDNSSHIKLDQILTDACKEAKFSSKYAWVLIAQVSKKMVLLKYVLTVQLDVSVLRRRIRNGRIRREIKVFESDMSSDMVSNVESITLNALESFETLKDISSEVQMEMENKYGGQWQCLVFNFGDQSIHTKKKKYIRYEFAELKVILFQT